MPKTTVHRLLDQMEVLGAVENVRGRYRIGAQTFRLGQSWEPAPGIPRVAGATVPAGMEFVSAVLAVAAAPREAAGHAARAISTALVS
jgi:DNA-binding IclR family transcriptional regulator